MLTQLPHLPAASADCAHWHGTLGAALRCGKQAHRERQMNRMRKVPSAHRLVPLTGTGPPIASPARTTRRVPLAERARMRGRIDLAQLVHGDQRVKLRRRHRGVAEQLLDYPDIGAAVEQVRGERMAQHMRRHLGQASPARRGPQRPPGALPRQPPAPRVQEQGRARLAAARTRRPARAARAPGRRRQRPWRSCRPAPAAACRPCRSGARSPQPRPTGIHRTAQGRPRPARWPRRSAPRSRRAVPAARDPEARTGRRTWRRAAAPPQRWRSPSAGGAAAPAGAPS